MSSIISDTKFQPREFFLTLTTLANVKEEVHEEIKANILQFPILAKHAGHSKDFQPPRCIKESLPNLNLPSSVEENVTPLHDSLYKDSFILQKARVLLTEIIDRATRPACTTHISIPLQTLERERCAICLEDLEYDVAELDNWKMLHSAVVTSCGHVFGGICLWTWLVENKTRTCPCCRRDFDTISESTDLTWKNLGDVWDWYIDRKHTMHDQKPGRHLWDCCSMEELQAQFEMQDEFPIELEHLVYIILDINVNLRAAHDLSPKNLGKYLKRTRIVVEGLCHFAPEQEALEIKTRVAKLIPFGLQDSNEKVGTIIKKEKPKVCGRLLNLLHASVKPFEKYVLSSEFHRSQIRDTDSIKLDRLQEKPGTGSRNRRFTSTQEWWEQACYYEPQSDFELSAKLHELRLEQTALLKVAQKYLQKGASGIMHSMDVYLMQRLAVVHETFDVFTYRLSDDEFGGIRSGLVEGDSKVIDTFEAFSAWKCQQKKIRKQAQMRKQGEP